MGKLILISGENGSGKSLFAERFIRNFDGKYYYIATMIPKTENNYLRIEKHRKQREELEFTTLELPYNVSIEEFGPDSVILLEDVSNLLANNMFEKGKGTDEVLNDIKSLVKKSKAVVAVTISGIKDCGYDKETAVYIKSLNEINKKLYDEAVISIKMIDGKPVYEKGEGYDSY